MSKLLLLECDRTCSLLSLLFFQQHQNSDSWGLDQIDAIKEAASALTILQEAGALEFNTYPSWTAELKETVALIVLDGCNTKHPKELMNEYLRRYSNVYYRAEYRHKPLLIMALRTVGRLDEAIISCQEDITKSAKETRNRIFGTDMSPQEPDVLQIFLCKQDFIQEVRHQNPAENYFVLEMRKVFGSNHTSN